MILFQIVMAGRLSGVVTENLKFLFKIAKFISHNL